MTSEKMISEARRQAALCDHGAQLLDNEAARAGEVLATRAAGSRISPPDWAEQKRQAAEGARTYAEQLRAQADNGTVTQTGIDAGRLVAHAAQMGGWLSSGGVASEARRALGMLLRSGVFRHVPQEPGQTVSRYELTTPAAAGPAADGAAGRDARQ